MKSKKILITSASSYVGFYIAKRLLMDGHEVVFTYRTRSPRVDELSKYLMATGLKVDFSEKPSIGNRVVKGLSLIINSTGAYPSQDISNEDVAQVNVASTVWISQILATLETPCNLINFSSLSVYGWPLPSAIDDLTRPSPTDVYGASKLISEQLFSRHSRDAAVINIRFPVVLGRGAHRAWLPRVLDGVRKGLTIDVYNYHMRYTTCTTLPDVYHIVKHIMDSYQKCGIVSVPIGSNPDSTIGEIVAYISDRVGVPARCRFIDDGTNCTQLYSSVASDIGYRFPNTSSCLKYWMDEELCDV